MKSHKSEQLKNVSKSGHVNKKHGKRRHVGPPDRGGFQRLIQTGAVAPALSVAGVQNHNAIDLVMVTYWM